MGALSDYLEQKLLEHSVGKTSFPIPTNTYLGLFTNTPTDSTGGTEAVGDGYVRKTVSWSSYSNGSISNTNTMTFTSNGGIGPLYGGTLTSWAILDAASGGNILWYGPLSANRTLQNGDQLVFNPGTVVLSMD